jgi:hypothetical protein
MQTKSIPERELVKICLEELCKKAGFADVEKMVQRDLEFLCESIESQTGVLISLSTIKRLLNGQFSRLPQIATLNAIARFSGYPHWRSFKTDKSGVQLNPAPHTQAEVTPPNADPPESAPHTQAGPSSIDRSRGLFPQPGTIRRNKFVSAKFLILGSLLVIATLGLLAIRKIGKPGLSNVETAQFSFVKTTSNDLPNTVVFRYNIDDVNADSFFIQQSWDRNRRVRIYKHNYTLTDIYYEPGYHMAKLIANDQIIKTADVSIPTDRWVFYAQKSLGSEPKYIFPANPFSNGDLQLTPGDLSASKIDPQKGNKYLMVYFPGKIEGNSDNFSLTFRIKVNALSNDLCPYFMPEIFCQRNFMYFASTLKGCVSELQAQFGENHLNGKTYDFSALGANVKDWQNVELTVKNKVVSIRINGKSAFSATYRQSCGLITGLGFISNELCEVDGVELKTPDGKNIYSLSSDHVSPDALPSASAENARHNP